MIKYNKYPLTFPSLQELDVKENDHKCDCFYCGVKNAGKTIVGDNQHGNDERYFRK